MTMVSFRVDEDDARAVQRWARDLGIDKSELLREALRRHLVRLAAEAEAASWKLEPVSDAETDFMSIADWGPAEDWSDWEDAAG